MTKRMRFMLAGLAATVPAIGGAAESDCSWVVGHWRCESEGLRREVISFNIGELGPAHYRFNFRPDRLPADDAYVGFNARLDGSWDEAIRARASCEGRQVNVEYTDGPEPNARIHQIDRYLEAHPGMRILRTRTQPVTTEASGCIRI